MRDRLAQTLTLLRFIPLCYAVDEQELPTGHKRVEKLDRETSPLATAVSRSGVFAVRRSLMKLAGTLDYLPS